jgi:HTH-type transcriptional regulator/antitoxin HigA
MDINGLNQSDLAPIVGYKSNLSAFLAGKRGLSKAVALKLAERFKVSPAIFLG